MNLTNRIRTIRERLKLFESGSIVRDMFTYIGGAIFIKGASVLLIPIYTKVLAPSDFGKLELVNSVSAVFVILFSFGLPTIFFTEYVHRDGRGKFELINSIALLYLFLSIPLYLLVYFVLEHFAKPVFSLIPPSVWIIVLIGNFFSFFQTLYFCALQMSKKVKLLTGNKVFVGIGSVLLNIILVYYLRLGIKGVLISNVVFMTISAIIAFLHYLFLGKIQLPKLNKLQTQRMLTVGLSFMGGSLSYFALNVMDRWLIAYNLGAYDLGIYSIAFRFGAILEPLVITPILAVYTPYIFERFAQGTYSQNIVKILMVSLCCCIAFGCLAFGLARFLVNHKFANSFPLIIPISIGYAFFFMSQISACIIVYKKDTSVLLKNVFLSAIFNLALNLYLTRFLGLNGAVLAFILSNFFWMLLGMYQARLLKLSITRVSVVDHLI